MDRLEVRPATSADHDGILAVPGLLDTTRRVLARDLADAARRRVLVAIAPGGEVVGVALATRQSDAAHVLDVAVARRWRRHGAATTLLAALAAAALADGVPAVTLEVRAGNASARALYAGLGFEDAGVRPGYYQDGEDAHVLWHRDLSSLARARTSRDSE